MKLIYMLSTMQMMHFETQLECDTFVAQFEQKKTKSEVVYFVFKDILE